MSGGAAQLTEEGLGEMPQQLPHNPPEPYLVAF